MNILKNNTKIKKNTPYYHTPKGLALCGVLTAIALTVFVIEAQIPAPVPFPGVKLGLSNIVTLFALMYLTPKDALMILVARIILGGIFTSAPSVIPYSLCGGLLCLSGEVILIKKAGKKFICEISIIGAILHNIGQLLCAAFTVKSFSVFAYFPVLAISGTICGTLCGLCILFTHKFMNKTISKLLKK